MQNYYFWLVFDFKWSIHTNDAYTYIKLTTYIILHLIHTYCFIFKVLTYIYHGSKTDACVQFTTIV